MMGMTRGFLGAFLVTLLSLGASLSLAHADRIVVLPVGEGGSETAGEVKEAMLNAAISELNRLGHTVVPDEARADLSGELMGCGRPNCGAQVAIALDAQLAMHLTLWNEDNVDVPREVVVTVMDREGHIFEQAIAVNGLEENAVEEGIKEAVQGVLNRRLLGAGTYIYFQGEPVGARCFVDDEDVGELPIRIEASSGLHNIRVEMHGYETFQTTVRVPDGTGAEETVPVDLPRIGADITEPPGGSNVLIPILGGALIAVGALVLVPPIVTLLRDGDLISSDPSTGTGDFVEFGALSTALLIGGSAMVLGGVAVMVIPSLGDSSATTASASYTTMF